MMKIDDDWVNIISDSTREIKQQTNTVFRQNRYPLDKLDINFLLYGNNWKDGLHCKDALLVFSKSSHNLVVMPKKVVGAYIFNPLFEEYSDGHQFKVHCQNCY